MHLQHVCLSHNEFNVTSYNLTEHLKFEFRTFPLELLPQVCDSLATQLRLAPRLVLQQIVCLNAWRYFMLIKLYKMGLTVVLK